MDAAREMDRSMGVVQEAEVDSTKIWDPAQERKSEPRPKSRPTSAGLLMDKSSGGLHPMTSQKLASLRKIWFDAPAGRTRRSVTPDRMARPSEQPTPFGLRASSSMPISTKARNPTGLLMDKNSSGLVQMSSEKLESLKSLWVDAPEDFARRSTSRRSSDERAINSIQIST